ncbi:MAG: CoA transferase [Candidatus Binataceae bacterium]|jgi:crotonobetainyl-CoA:carnitine CoA-transferase CaiB-like acyl-CoA transferase
MADKPRHVLDGYKVLDFTQFLAGPTVTRMMAEMGADIIKVEIAPIGDFSRGLPFIHDGRSAYYIQQNRGKKSLCIDPRKPEGLKILKDLVRTVDVMVENFSPGVIGRLGLDYATVSALNPRIVMCSISSMGQTGPLAKRPGFDYIGAAYAGVLDMIGEPDKAPVFPQLGIGDVSTGIAALSAITSALLYRERTGEGQFVETSLLDCYFSYHEVNVQALSASKGAMRPRRAGSFHYVVAPVGIYSGKEHYIFIVGGLPHQWPEFCRAMSKPELIEDPHFVDVPNRAKNSDALNVIVQGWLDSVPTDEKVCAALEEHRIPYAPVLTVEEAMNHPHMRERGTIRTVHDRFMDDFELPGFPLRFSKFPGQLELDAPTLGEHNGEILRNRLGYSEEQIRKLEADGILHSGPR